MKNGCSTFISVYQILIVYWNVVHYLLVRCAAQVGMLKGYADKEWGILNGIL